MALPSGDLSICNMALSLCGERRISSLSGTDPSSQVCDLWYTQTVNSIQRNYVWNCCKKAGNATKIGASTATITGITKANPGVVTTAAAHGFSDGDLVLISDVLGMTQVNDLYFTVTVISPTTFSIGTNTTAYTTYVSGGTITLQSADFTDVYQLPTDCIRFLSIEGSNERLQALEYDLRGRRIYYNADGANSIKVRYIGFEYDVSKWDAILTNVIIYQLALHICYSLTKSLTIKAELKQELAVHLMDAVSVDALERPPLRQETSAIVDARVTTSDIVDAGIWMDFGQNF